MYLGGYFRYYFNSMLCICILFDTSLYIPVWVRSASNAACKVKSLRLLKHIYIYVYIYIYIRIQVFIYTAYYWINTWSIPRCSLGTGVYPFSMYRVTLSVHWKGHNPVPKEHHRKYHTPYLCPGPPYYFWRFTKYAYTRNIIEVVRQVHPLGTWDVPKGGTAGTSFGALECTEGVTRYIEKGYTPVPKEHRGILQVLIE